jgi:hypothetical protein
VNTKCAGGQGIVFYLDKPLYSSGKAPNIDLNIPEIGNNSLFD